MEKRLILRIILAFWVVLLICGCAVDLGAKKIFNGTTCSAGWVGIDVAYKISGISASHTIVRVEKDSPASRAGIRAGDQIWFVGPENAGYMNM